MNELKRCPFCGGEAKSYVKDYGDTHYWRVSCSSDRCGVNPVTNVYHTEAGAIAAWNTRAEMGYEDVQILLDELGAKLEQTCRNVDEEYPFFECSECGCHAVVGYGGSGTGLTNYCPNCGAKVVSE